MDIEIGKYVRPDTGREIAVYEIRGDVALYVVKWWGRNRSDKMPVDRLKRYYVKTQEAA